MFLAQAPRFPCGSPVNRGGMAEGLSLPGPREIVLGAGNFVNQTLSSLVLGVPGNLVNLLVLEFSVFLVIFQSLLTGLCCFIIAFSWQPCVAPPRHCDSVDIL